MMADDYPDSTRYPSTCRAYEVAPVDAGNEVVIHMIEGDGTFHGGFPVLGAVRRIDEPDGLSPRSDYVLRVHIPDEQTHFMADGHDATTILTQLRCGRLWVVLDELDSGVTELCEQPSNRSFLTTTAAYPGYINVYIRRIRFKTRQADRY